MPELANLPNSDLKRGLAVPQAAKKHGWPELMVWSLALNRRCWSFDIVDISDVRPGIEHFCWDVNNLKWPVYGKTRPDLILVDNCLV
jgi:hypothetical protein